MLAVAANPGASIAAPPAVRVRSRLRNPLATCLIAIAATVAVPTIHSAQPPGDAAAELAASGRLDAALALLDGWLADHPGDARLFPVVLQVVTAAPVQSTVDAVLGRFEHALAGDSVGVLRAVPADLAELRGHVGQALDELRRSRLPDAAGRRALLLLELGQIGDGAPPRDAPVAMHAGLARAGQGLEESTLEQSLRTAFAVAGQAGGGADGAVAGYGLVALLNATQRSREASTVLAELGRRYPRSPEYALASAELRGGPAAGSVTMPAVVALPSPAMLLARAMLACPAPCTIPAVALPQPSAPQERPPPAGPAAVPRQTAVARAAATAPPPSEPPRDRVVLVPARVAEPAAVPRQPAAASPAQPRPAPATTVAAAAPAAPAAPAATAATSTATDGGSRGAGSGAAARSAGAAGAQAAAAPVARSRTVRYTSAQPDAGSGVTPAAAASSHPAAAAAPTPAPSAGKLIRVTAQPATRPLLSTDRVFVPADPEPGTPRRSPSARSTTVAARDADDRSSAVRSPSRSTHPSAVRVSSLPDPAAFVVQVGAYGDPDNALEMELRLRQAGFPATARSYRHRDGSIVHRVGVGGNLTRAKVEQLHARLQDAGFEAYISRRDVVSYLPPEPRRR